MTNITTNISEDFKEGYKAGKKETLSAVGKEIDELDKTIHSKEGRININGKEHEDFDCAGEAVLFLLKSKLQIPTEKEKLD